MMYYIDQSGNLYQAEIPQGDREATAEEVALHTAAQYRAALDAMSISPRQIRQALTRAGLRQQVESAVAAGDQDIKDWYEFSTAFERLNPQVTAMGQALGQTPEQLDALWRLGASL